jgi:hypothetical protein
LQSVEGDADRRDPGVQGARQAFLIKQGAVGNEGRAQSNPGKVTAQVVPLWMQERLASSDLDIAAAELRQFPRRAPELLSRQLARRNLAALVLTVDAAQVAPTGDFKDAGAGLAHHPIKRVPVQTKRTPM